MESPNAQDGYVVKLEKEESGVFVASLYKPAGNWITTKRGTREAMLAVAMRWLDEHKAPPRD